MRRLLIINYLSVLMIALLSVSLNVQAQPKEDKSLQIKIQKLEDNVSEVRRDQLNYKIEKDLLKETFSSNYQTINIVLAIVLGIFTVVGFLGIRDIGTLRREFVSELERLNGLRREFESKIAKIGEEQEKVKADYLEILKTNEDQNKRIKILELQEKIASLMIDKNYQRALEYVAVALDLSPDNMVLLKQKAHCLWRSNDLAGAAAIYAKIFSLEPSDTDALINSLEIYLISNRIDDYEPLVKKHAEQIKTRENDEYLIQYFEALKNYQLEDIKRMKGIIEENLKKYKAGKLKRLNWDFTDVISYLSTKPIDNNKTILLLLINVLKGDLDRDDALKKINELS